MGPVAVIEYYVFHTHTTAFIIRPDLDEPIVERLDIGRDAVRSAALRVVEETSPENINPAHPEWSTDFAFLDPVARALIDPLRPHLDGIDAVCIVPHGYLFYLPFHAFRGPDGTYLIEERAVVYAPSAALMMLARLHRKPARPARFLGLGTGRQADPPARRQDFEDEARAIASLSMWQDYEALTGAAASASALLERGRTADVVHCACHGHFDASDPLASGLLLSDGQQLPELRPDGAPPREFLLSARDVAAAPLQADLVYLSACVSGRHDIQPGDEILGLVRALITAGAASIVASLWPVAAWGSTRLLMETFYKRWLVDGRPKARAIQEAQLETLARFDHPYHWAPFSLVGDWR
jgi:CHAT domain-containing protein